MYMPELFFVLYCLCLYTVDHRTMNHSLNPFLNGGLDESFGQLGLETPSHTMMNHQLNQFVQTASTPQPTAYQAAMTRPATASGMQTIYVQTQAPMSDKIIRKFSGYMHEDGSKFMQEFESYLTLSGIDNEQRIIAAFHLHLKGPALTWFHTLPSRDSWSYIKEAFNTEYGNNVNDPRLISEAAAFDNLTLNTGQAIEEFHAIVLEKGTRLNKSDRDMSNKFINGLPSQLAFFVRAGRINNFREALHSAEIGEAHGYRIHTSVTQPPSVLPTPTPSVTLNPSASPYVPPTVNALTSASAVAKGQHTSYSRKPPRTCFSCNGEGHIKTRCNWIGQGSPEPNKTCQLCFQKGHIAPTCKKLSKPSSNVICQLCNTSGHSARDCDLNTKSLGPTPNSQA